MTTLTILALCSIPVLCMGWWRERVQRKWYQKAYAAKEKKLLFVTNCFTRKP
jgi:hypothetical protein